MILRWIEKARKKPKVVRDQYAFIGAVLLTAIVVVGWSLSLPAHFAEVSVDDAIDNETTGAFSQFFQDAKQNFATVFKSTDSGEVEQESEPLASSSSESSVSMPALTPETVAGAKDKQAFGFGEPRKVLIATSSAAAGQASPDPQPDQTSSTTQE